jgi:hypothetical protein
MDMSNLFEKSEKLKLEDILGIAVFSITMLLTLNAPISMMVTIIFAGFWIFGKWIIN